MLQIRVDKKQNKLISVMPRVNFHYKGNIQMCGWKGYTFQASEYMNRYHFHPKVYEWE